jgi:hypothetical protein
MRLDWQDERPTTPGWYLVDGWDDGPCSRRTWWVELDNQEGLAFDKWDDYRELHEITKWLGPITPEFFADVKRLVEAAEDLADAAEEDYPAETQQCLDAIRPALAPFRQEASR